MFLYTAWVELCNSTSKWTLLFLTNGSLISERGTQRKTFYFWMKVSTLSLTYSISCSVGCLGRNLVIAALMSVASKPVCACIRTGSIGELQTNPNKCFWRDRVHQRTALQAGVWNVVFLLSTLLHKRLMFNHRYGFYLFQILFEAIVRLLFSVKLMACNGKTSLNMICLCIYLMGWRMFNAKLLLWKATLMYNLTLCV